MHVHILNKVWDLKQGDWDTDTVTHRGTQVSMKLCIGNGADISSQVDINSCTAACTHSKQVVGTEMRLLENKHIDIQGHTDFH